MPDDPKHTEAVAQVLTQTAESLETRLAALGEMGSFVIVAQLPKSDQVAQILRMDHESGSPLTLVGALDRAKRMIHRTLEERELVGRLTETLLDGELPSPADLEVN